MHSSESCCRPGCAQPAVATLRNETLCLDHFCNRCYEALECIEKRAQSLPANLAFLEEELHVANECARSALHVSFGAHLLHNLDRARLLDILLWSGDIVNSYHAKADRRVAPQLRPAHKKPFLGRHKSSVGSRS